MPAFLKQAAPRLFVAAIAAVAAVIAVAGCGAASGGKASSAHNPPPPAHLASGWRDLRLASGAVLPEPPGWRTIAGDPGSASAAVFATDGLVRAYLNATPAAPEETLADWTRFRIRHNADEERDVRLLRAQTNVARGDGRESCVVDRYTTTRTRYEELACIVTTPRRRSATVLVAAAQPTVWRGELPILTYALGHFTP